MSVDQLYANGAYIPGAAGYVERWTARAQDWRTSLAAMGRARLDISYGPHPRHRLDLFVPEGAPRGMFIFVHGGYWRAFDCKTWSHFAAGAVARGWAVAMPSYRLAPEVRLAQITGDTMAAISKAAEQVDGPIVLAGHSAGGHLVARALNHGAGLPTQVASRLARVVPISPLSDLRPLMATQMNVDLRIDAAEAWAESPLLLPKALPVSTTVWVGAEERPAFLDQAKWLTECWPDTNLRMAPGRHHFDILDDLLTGDSPIMTAALAGL